jgi:hypothetical protein
LFVGLYARRVRHAKVQKFFGSFFQKRTFCPSANRAAALRCSLCIGVETRAPWLRGLRALVPDYAEAPRVFRCDSDVAGPAAIRRLCLCCRPCGIVAGVCRDAFTSASVLPRDGSGGRACRRAAGVLARVMDEPGLAVPGAMTGRVYWTAPAMNTQGFVPEPSASRAVRHCDDALADEAVLRARRFIIETL